MPRILILHASVGNGHKTAAMALKEEFETNSKNQVVVEDLLDYALPVFKAIYADSYLELSQKAPDFMDTVYKVLDRSNSEFRKEMLSLISRVGVPNFKAFGTGTLPDIIVHTHHLGMDLLKNTISKYPTIKSYCVVTDYTASSLWAHKEIQRYFVATELVRDVLVHRGIDTSHIQITGIPLRGELKKKKDKIKIQESLSITKTPVVLLFGTGLKYTRVLNIIQQLSDRKLAGTVIVVAGRNVDLEENLYQIDRQKLNLQLLTYGFTEKIDDLVVASDVVITKAGGLTVSELLYRQKPMILMCGIKGQEEWNADYICSQGAGVQVHLSDMVSYALQKILQDDEFKKSLSRRAKTLFPANAATTIVRRILHDQT